MKIKYFSLALLIPVFFCAKFSNASVETDNSIVGSGINLLNDSISNEPLTNSHILGLSSNQIQESEPIKSWTSNYSFFQSTETLIKDYGLKAGTQQNVSCPVFNLGVAAKFGLSGEVNKYSYKNSSYLIYSNYNVYNVRKLEDAYDCKKYQALVKNYVLDDVDHINNDPSEENIKVFLQRYGTHIITSANYGACADIYYKISGEKKILNKDVSLEGLTGGEANVIIENIPLLIKGMYSSSPSYDSSSSSEEIHISQQINARGSSSFIEEYNISDSTFINWKNNVSRESSVYIGYPCDGLIGIYEYLPDKYMTAKQAIKDYIENHSNYEMSIKDDSRSVVISRSETTSGGGKRHVSWWDNIIAPIDDFKKMGYSSVKIRINLELERKTADQAYISLWNVIESNNNFIWVSDQVKISSGWNEYGFSVSYNGNEDIPLSTFNSDEFKMKFDSWGRWYYNIRNCRITFTFS